MNRYYDELYHHGIKGQKWGIRRYQNEDGTLTEEGKKRYGVDADGKMSEKGMARRLSDSFVTVNRDYKEHGRNLQRELDDAMYRKNSPEHYQKLLDEYGDKVKKAYGNNVSDDEINLAAARLARGDVVTKNVIGLVGDSILTAVGIASIATSSKNTTTKGERNVLIGAGAAAAALGSLSGAASITSIAVANKNLKKARENYYGTGKLLD